MSIKRNWGKWATIPVLIAVAAFAGIISYTHIYNLTVALHQLHSAAQIYPFAVDGLIIVGSCVVLNGYRIGWAAAVPGLAISVFANVESGIRYGALASIWAGVPAVSLFLATFVLERYLMAQAQERAPQYEAALDLIADGFAILAEAQAALLPALQAKNTMDSMIIRSQDVLQRLTGPEFPVLDGVLARYREMEPAKSLKRTRAKPGDSGKREKVTRMLGTSPETPVNVLAKEAGVSWATAKKWRDEHVQGPQESSRTSVPLPDPDQVLSDLRNEFSGELARNEVPKILTIKERMRVGSDKAQEYRRLLQGMLVPMTA
jgi:hypothetical protein